MGCPILTWNERDPILIDSMDNHGAAGVQRFCETSVQYHQAPAC